ncbi:MAG TPA: COX15/CtaA family protein [Acidobacteriota bacterium]|jgi:cytochrome c oxidase assembly protein subunit 15
MTYASKPGERLWLHRYACFTAFCTLLLIVAGGLVTSNDAALAVPDWPLSFGKWMPDMVGGVLYEHGHRMVATFVGMLTVILAIWISLKEPRRWVRRLGWGALAAVIAQGLLGGITVLYFLPPPVSMAHASLAQGFFCIIIALSVVTGPKWVQEEERLEPSDRPGLRLPALVVVAVVYIQLILGAGYRHNALGVMPHVTGGVLVLAACVWLCLRALVHYGKEWRAWAALLQTLVISQFILGIATFFIRKIRLDFPQPTPQYVWSSTAHVALGALVLATALVFALRIYRRYERAVPDRSGLMVEEVNVQATR